MKLFISILAGAAIGFLVGYAGKCASGTCPLTSSPYVSAFIGALVAAIIVAAK